MSRLLATTCLGLVLMVGCRAPTPSMNSLIPYGSATVPSPSTGTVGTSTDYYSSPNGGGATNPAAGLQGSNGSLSSPATITDRAVQPASFTAGVPTEASPTAFTASGGSTLQLNGMPLNDATTVSAQQPLPSGTPTNLSQLPSATSAPSLLRILGPGPASSGIAPPVNSSGTASMPSSAWQQRECLTHPDAPRQAGAL